MASINNLPRPGHAKIVSVTVAKAIRVPNSKYSQELIKYKNSNYR